MLNVTNSPFRLSAIVLNVIVPSAIMLSVLAPAFATASIVRNILCRCSIKYRYVALEH
jgi:hypothetical protein